MAGGEAEFRANWTKLVLKWVRQRPDRDAVLATIGTDAIDRVHRAGVFEWLPKWFDPADPRASGALADEYCRLFISGLRRR